jgi:hypothetical protein
MTVTEGTRRGLKLFKRAGAPTLAESGMLEPPELDQNALDALPEFGASGGSVLKMLFGDPTGPDGGGLSLVWCRFGSNYKLPRHSHGEDCLYYVVSGELHMGNRTVRAGEGFFVPADAPYGYTTGPDGLELLEFRGTSTIVGSRNVETASGWQQILKAVRANRDRWAEQIGPYR